jgi:ATP-binding cassette subfamily B protein
MEAIGMTLIAIFAYTLTIKEEGVNSAIPLLGALALGAQRLMPALQQTYSAYSTIKGSEASFNDVLNLLDQPISKSDQEQSHNPIPFKNVIKLTNLSFQYSKDLPFVLKGINLQINKGDRIGFIGKTGCGKSTLLDIIMGLLPPTSGNIEIDGKSLKHNHLSEWRSHIAHVPQNIFLSDASIEENIAFGVPKTKIDHLKVEQVANLAQLEYLKFDLDKGYKTLVGERGMRLSGGQRQRIGIARALYKNADVIIFDEATSALDNKTERLIMESIENLNKDITILIIAHRLSTLKNCDKIFELSNGSVITSKVALEK